MANIKPRFRAPKKVEKGEVVTLKTLISHPMESGQRKDKDGNVIPRKIINNFTCKANGAVAFSVDLEPSISSPAYVEFSVKIMEETKLELIWTEDGGATWDADATVKVG